MDDELQRLEAVLGMLPDHRALPDIEWVLAEAGLDATVLADERAHKLLMDALTTRPHGHLEGVQAVNTEVELLVLEVRDLTAKLVDGTGDRQKIDARLAWARTRLDELTAEL